MCKGIMEIEQRDAIEAEVLEALKQVRLVFELGFPQDLVTRAGEVVNDAFESGRLITRGEIRYPACWILNIINIARTREGRGFWNGEATEFFRTGPHKLTQIELARKTFTALTVLGLETFDDVVANEHALKYLTPIFMHSGIPINNVPDLVALIDASISRHRIGADEQIQDWSRTPHGFGQLWRAAVILFKSGGAIATDLLERINEALIFPERATETGLPPDIIEALHKAPLNASSSRRSATTQLPKPFIYLDLYSCQGPTLRLPAMPNSVIDKWRVTGSDRSEFIPRSNEHLDIPLDPKAEYEVVGFSNGKIVTSRIFQAYKNLPIQFFKASNGRLIERRGSQIDLTDSEILAIHHNKIESVTISQEQTYPPQAGNWGPWKISEINTRGSATLEFTDKINQETVRIVRAPVRPHLLEPDESLVSVSADGLPVYSVPPQLVVELGSIEASLVRVVVEHDDIITESSLADLSGVSQFSLDTLIPKNGTYSVRVVGPIGFGMPVQKFVLVRDLQVSQSPPIAFPGQPIQITATAAEHSTTQLVVDGEPESVLTIEGTALTVQVVRLSWAIRTRELLSSRLGTDQVSIGIDQIANSGESYFSVDTGRNAYIQVAISLGDTIPHIESPDQRSSRRTIDLAVFADTVKQSNLEVIKLMIRINDGDWIPAGRITSNYFAELTEMVETVENEVHSLAFSISENRPFKNRVLRFWPIDRPWDQSFKADLDNSLRTKCQIHIPPGTKSGEYRVAVRIEELWSLPSTRPRKADPTAFDIQLQFGEQLNVNDPIDRLIHAIKVEKNVAAADDVQTQGHVIISLLDQLYRDEGVQGLMGHQAALAYNSLAMDPVGIVRHIVQALELNLLDRESRVVISLALMPTVFKIEDQQDLSIPDDVEELVWNEIPWIAAILEPWNDKTDARQLWKRHLGWPSFADSEIDSIDIDDLDSPDELVAAAEPQSSLPNLREILVKGFDQQVRSLIDRSLDFWNELLEGEIGSLSNLPLSRDAEFRAVIETIPKAQLNKQAIQAWREQWNSTITSAHAYLKNDPYRYLIDQYDVPAAWPELGNYKWVLKDIGAIADYAILTRSSSQTPTQALIAIYEYLPEWVSYSLLLALSLAPYHESSKD
jgi:hypothetical protein